jgi:Holliday junction DNA helicase RuvA
MISYLEGVCIDVAQKYTVVLTGGVGYKVHLSEESLRALVVDSQVAFWIYTSVREDAFDLFGFHSRDDLEFFELLLSVSGIGPRSALSILSVAPSATLATAIGTGDTSYLTKVSGIGRKTAEKIVIELRDKMIGRSDGTKEAGRHLRGDSDAVEALQALGYSQNEARKAIQEIDPTITDTNQKIKAALRQLGI